MVIGAHVFEYVLGRHSASLLVMFSIGLYATSLLFLSYCLLGMRYVDA